MKKNAGSAIDIHERLARHLDWNLLRTFIAVVQHKGFSRAAEHVHLTQSAVSHAIKRLEQQLDLKLIERDARRFEVTEAGQIIYTRAVEIHNQVSRLSDVRQVGREKIFGHLRLLFASRIESPVLDALLGEFKRANPGVTLSIDIFPSVEIQSMIERGLGSVGLCLVREKPKNMESFLFFRQRYGLFCGQAHKYFGRTDIKAKDLRHEDFVTFQSDQLGGVLSSLSIYREKHAYEGRVVATSNNLDEVIRLTEIGIGIGLIPMHIGSRLVSENKLFRLPPAKGIGPIDVHFLWNPATTMTKVEKLFIAFAREICSRT